MEAIRYGDHPDTRARLTWKIDQALDHDHLKSLLNRNALVRETMSSERLFAVKEEMEKAKARRLQPFFVQAFFTRALDTLGGTAHPREVGRFEITYIPTAIRECDCRITGRNRRERKPVLKRYSRITFQLYDAAGQRKYLTAKECSTFLEAAERADRPARTFCMTLVYTGSRISEALQLTADRVDLSGKVIRVREPQEAP